jgi:hypothetical protein
MAFAAVQGERRLGVAFHLKAHPGSGHARLSKQTPNGSSSPYLFKDFYAFQGLLTTTGAKIVERRRVKSKSAWLKICGLAAEV